MKKSLRESLPFLAYASPWLIGLLVLLLVPIIASLYLSMTSWDILTPPKWVGLGNYREIFNDPLFYKSMRVTLVYSAFSVPLGVIISFFIALLLNNDIKGMNIFRTIYYLPAVVSGAAVSLLWAWMFNPEFGLINNLLLKVGINGPAWIYDEVWVMPSLILMSLWGIGGGIIMYLSGLQGIPTELYEAATIDGAGWWQRLRHVTLPSMSPVLLFTNLTGIIGAMQTFTQAYVMTSGGPNNASLFYAFYIYSHAFSWHKMGKACALAWILFAVILVLSLAVLYVSRRYVYYESKEAADIV